MISNIEYLKLRFRLASPMTIGSGGNANTDSDVILDSSGRPIIPATALAGVISHFFKEQDWHDTGFWGCISDNGSKPSRIIFYDGTAETADPFITIRDSVALENKLPDDADGDIIPGNKVGIDGAKFDKEAVETDAIFSALIELHDPTDTERERVLRSLAAIDCGVIRIGSKTTRGYGQLDIISLMSAKFDLAADRDNWLGFDQYDLSSDKCYSDVDGFPDKFANDLPVDIISLTLKQEGAVSIRSNTIKDIYDADYMQLSTNDGTPVIPGTSWAGAFRSRFRELCNDAKFTDAVFGYVDLVNCKQQKSKITFTESRIENSTEKLITRTAIDRYTAGTKTSALYSEITQFDGTCTLDITLMKNTENRQKALNVLSAVICDLDRGYLAVGGLTAVGRGLFSVTKMCFNGTDVTDAMKKGDIKNMTGGADNE
ncbi:MAG: hypothetical protein IIZ18_02965 [Ruminococcus sp.]|nr:hypothetical protein [Ruminococcus sp.]